MQLATLVATFLGGLGFFLLGMKLMTEGFKVAAGGALEDRLRRSTRTRVRALATGCIMTAVVQSSSAVTVATIGFVNAGILSLSSAIWVVFGSNVGTTTTGWIVSASGIDVNLEALALPIVGIGTAIQLGRSRGRGQAIGQAVTGLGLFFVGLAVLQDAFGEVGETADLSILTAGGPFGAILLVGVGILLTTAMQSSSAAIALTITAAFSGVIDLAGAASMVIGANIGTTSTALFTTLNATPNAKRVAFGHTAFNLVAALAAFAILPALLWAHAWLHSRGSAPPLGVTLALFHTIFNIAGLLAMLALDERLVSALERRFHTGEEEEGQLRHIDAAALEVPSVGLRAIALEVERLGELAMRAAAAGLDGDTEGHDKAARAHAGLLSNVTKAIDELERGPLAEEVTLGLRFLIGATRHFLVVVEESAELIGSSEKCGLEQSLVEVLSAVDFKASREIDEAREAYDRMDALYDSEKQSLLVAAGSGQVPASQAMHAHARLAQLRRVAKHLVRGAVDIQNATTGGLDEHRLPNDN